MVAAYGGGAATHAPQTATPADGSAHCEHGERTRGSARSQSPHNSAPPAGATHNSQRCGSASRASVANRCATAPAAERRGTEALSNDFALRFDKNFCCLDTRR